MTVHHQESCKPSWERMAEVAALCAIKMPSRARQQKWDAAHMKTASCRLTITEHLRFKAACRRLRLTRYQVLRYMIDLFVQGVERYGNRYDDRRN